MSDDALSVLCGRCRVEIEETEEQPDSTPIAVCPSCGVGNTLEVIEREVSRFIEDQLTDGLGGSQKANHDDHAREFSPSDEPHRGYRFVVDLDHLR